MLVLSRKPKESIVIADSIKVTIVEVRGGRVKIGVEAPPDVIVHRHEVAERSERRLFGRQFGRPRALAGY